MSKVLDECRAGKRCPEWRNIFKHACEWQVMSNNVRNAQKQISAVPKFRFASQRFLRPTES